jgi:transposase-like protein
MSRIALAPCTFPHVQNRVGSVNCLFIIAAHNAPWVTAAGGRRMGGRQADRAEACNALGAEPEPSADDATALRDAARAMMQALDCHQPTQCPACGGSALQRWGKGRSEVQRWRCRVCERSFATTTGTLLAGLHAPGKLRMVLLDMLSDEPASCRRLAAKLAVSATTAWAWRQRVNRAFQLITADRLVDTALEAPGPHVTTPKVTGPPIGPDVAASNVAIDGIVVVRESRKASREWVDHARDPASHPAPDRLRWVDYQEQRLPLPQPMTPYLLPVRLFRDQRGNYGAALVVKASGRGSWPHRGRRPMGDRGSDVAAGIGVLGVVDEWRADCRSRGSGERAIDARAIRDVPSTVLRAGEAASRWLCRLVRSPGRLEP